MHTEQLLAYSEKYLGNYTQIKQAILRCEPYLRPQFSAQAITILDPRYPTHLKRLSEPPFVLYTQGNLEALKRCKLAVIGSRDMCTYAEHATKRMIQELNQHYAIVSGLAKGVDGCAHQSAIQNNTITIAVLGFGFNYMYPQMHCTLAETIRETGLLVSQYPPHTPIEKFRFVERNRIIAALSDKVCVMQAGLKSGTMSTVNAALDCGIEVYCLPYRYDEIEGKGNNLLIQQGAFILTNFDELIKL